MSNTPIVELEKLNLVLNTDVHREWSVRDVFTNFFSDTTSIFGREKDRLHILKDLDLKIYRGDRIGLLGMNGAGKTTLGRCIAGIFRPTRGKISVHVPCRAIFNTQVGIQPQLTGRENAELLTHLMYPDEENVKAIVDDALKFSELGRFVDVAYRTYSNGMQARLCLSLISAMPSELLILDEVFDGADTFFKEKISKRVLDIIQLSGAVVFMSHSANQIKRVCNRVLVLHHGEILCDADPDTAINFYNKMSETKVVNLV